MNDSFITQYKYFISQCTSLEELERLEVKIKRIEGEICRELVEEFESRKKSLNK